MRQSIIVLVLLALVSAAAATSRPWHPTAQDEEALVSQTIAEYHSATQPPQKGDTCLTIELRARFEDRDLPPNIGCQVDDHGIAYFNQK